jgi:hypothetical protein
MLKMLIVLLLLAMGSTSAIGQDLEAYKAAYAKAADAILAEYFARKLGAEAAYAAELKQLRGAVMQAGNLKGLRMVDEMIEAFETDKTVPDHKDTKIPVEIRRAAYVYGKALYDSNAAKNEKLRTLKQKRLKKLDDLMRQYTRQGAIDAAEEVEREMNAIGKLGANPPGKTMPPASKEKKVTMTFKAYIDGFDTLKFRANKAWYVHHSFSLPGRHGGNNHPTYFGEAEWMPKWNGNTSEPYLGILPPLRRQPLKRSSITIVQARGSVKITEEPSQKNDFTLSVHFSDPADGPSWYEVTIQLDY